MIKPPSEATAWEPTALPSLSSLSLTPASLVFLHPGQMSQASEDRLAYTTAHRAVPRAFQKRHEGPGQLSLVWGAESDSGGFRDLV